MVQRKHDEDLFKNTTMTFGEHLEELRVCLFRSLVGLVLGFAVGLWFGNAVVRLIQEPLTDSLESYYGKQADDRLKARIDGLQATEGEATEEGGAAPLPEHLKRYEDLIKEDRLLFDEVYVQPRDILAQLHNAYPESFEGVEIPRDDSEKNLRKSDLMPIYIWHSIAEDDRIKTKSLNAHEAFMIWIKASLLVGFLIASPWIFYQIWSFVAAGLYPQEKSFVHVFLPFSIALFLAGAALAFFMVIPVVLDFLFKFNSALGIDPDPRISEWLGFVLMLPLGFGISFQLPLVMLFLQRIGVFSVEIYIAKWRIAILVISVLSMFLTPADPTSMLLMAVPLTILYFGGIILCQYMPNTSSPFAEEEGD